MYAAKQELRPGGVDHEHGGAAGPVEIRTGDRDGVPRRSGRGQGSDGLQEHDRGAAHEGETATTAADHGARKDQEAENEDVRNPEESERRG